MAKTPESDELVRDVIAAHLREGEELLWVGRPRQGPGPRPVLAYVLPALIAAPSGAYAGYMASAFTGGPSAWVVGLAVWAVVFGWLVQSGIAGRRSTWYGVTSRRVIEASRTTRTVSHSFDLAGDEPLRVAAFPVRPGGARRGGPVFVCPMGVEDVGAVERAIQLARTKAASVPGAREPTARDELGEEAAGPLARFLRPAERVLWAGRPGWTPADTRALAAFAVAAVVALAAAVVLTEHVWSAAHRWATAIGAVGLCVVAGVAFIGLCRRRAWCAVSSERILAAVGPRRHSVTWADLRSLRHLRLREPRPGRGSVSVRTGLPVPTGLDVGERGHVLGAPARLAFLWWRDAAAFYHALSDARRQALRRAERPRPGAEQAEWASPPCPGRSPWPPFLAFVAGSLVLALAVGWPLGWAGGVFGDGWRDSLLDVRGAEEEFALLSSMAVGAALCGLAWWFASLPPGRQLKCRIATPRRVVSVLGAVGPVFVSCEPAGVPTVGRIRAAHVARAAEPAGAVGDRAGAGPGSCGQGEPPAEVLPEAARRLAGALEGGERLVWSGRACAGPLRGSPRAAVVAVVLGCTAGVEVGAFGAVPLWALPFSAMAGGGLGIAVFSGVWRLVAGGGQYAVTSQRVVARGSVPLSRVRSVDLAGGRDLTLVERADGVGDVTLVDGSRDERAGALGSLARWVVGPRRLVLHGVPQAVEVFKLIQWARAGAVRQRDGEEGHGEDAGER